jgi:hypothetical protein
MLVATIKKTMYYVTLTKSTSQFAVYSLYIYILSAGLINTGICNDYTCKLTESEEITAYVR